MESSLSFVFSSCIDKIGESLVHGLMAADLCMSEIVRDFCLIFWKDEKFRSKQQQSMKWTDWVMKFADGLFNTVTSGNQFVHDIMIMIEYAYGDKSPQQRPGTGPADIDNKIVVTAVDCEYVQKCTAVLHIISVPSNSFSACSWLL